MNVDITTDDYPESWQKRLKDGMQVAVPTTASFDVYFRHWSAKDPLYAAKTLKRYMRAFKEAYDYFEAYPKGIRRAEKAFQEMGKKINRGLHERKLEGEPPPTCKAKCSACCSILVTLTDSEADALVSYVKDRNIKLDRKLVEIQSTARTDEDFVQMLSWERRRCPVLGEDGNCRAYEARPLVCRKFLVASPSWMCDTRLSSTAAIIIDPVVEGITAAQMALEEKADRSDDNLSVQLLQRLTSDDDIWNQEPRNESM